MVSSVLDECDATGQQRTTAVLFSGAFRLGSAAYGWGLWCICACGCLISANRKGLNNWPQFSADSFIVWGQLSVASFVSVSLESISPHSRLMSVTDSFIWAAFSFLGDFFFFLLLVLQGVVLSLHVCLCKRVCLPYSLGAHWHCGWLMWIGFIPCGHLIMGSISLFLSPWLTGAVTNGPAGRREAALGGEERCRRVKKRNAAVLPIMPLALSCFFFFWPMSFWLLNVCLHATV